MASGPPSGRPSGVWFSIALGLLLNLVSLVGVAFWGWPAGNVFILFWIENVVLGIWTIPKILSAKGDGGLTPMTVNGVKKQVGPGGTAVFFCLHYGVFCIVHLVFTVLIAWKIEIVPSFWFLGFPALLILLRYSLETMVTWYGDSGRRHRVSPGTAMMQPYPRIITLQFAAIISFILFVVAAPDAVSALNGLRTALTPVLGPIAPGLLSDASFAVFVLVLAKAVVDVWTTRRAFRSPAV